MRDPRYDGLAELVLDHSLRLQPGDVLRIEGDAAAAAPLVVPLHREAIKRGAHAYTALDLSGLKEVLVEQGSDEQLDFVSDRASRARRHRRIGHDLVGDEHALIYPLGHRPPAAPADRAAAVRHPSP